MFQDTAKGRAAEAGLWVSRTEEAQMKCRFAPANRLERKPLVDLRLRASLKTESGEVAWPSEQTAAQATKAAGVWSLRGRHPRVNSSNPFLCRLHGWHTHVLGARPNQLPARVLLDGVATPAAAPPDREEHQRRRAWQIQHAPHRGEPEVDIGVFAGDAGCRTRELHQVTGFTG